MSHRILVLFVTISSAVAASDPTSCTATRADEPPSLDGRLTEEFWKTAPPNGDFAVFKGDGRRVGHTVFRLAYDDAWLYLGVDCHNADMSALQPLVEGHDKGACNDDSVELFLDPGTGGRLYFHYMLSFANARDERRIRGRHRDLLWDVPWRSATHVRRDGWSGEMAVPLYVLASYGRPSQFAINVTRNRRIPVIDAQHVVVEENRELSSWSPVLKGFHEPERFVPLAGIADVKLRVPLLAKITETRVRPYYLEDGRNLYGLDIEIRGYNQQRGELELQVIDRPSAGEPQTIEQTVAIEGTATRKLRVGVPVATLCSREVLLRLCDPSRKEVLETFRVEDLSALNVMTAFLDRNYYTTETRALAVCKIGLPADTLKLMVLEARSVNGHLLGSLPTLTQRCKVAVGLDKLPLGRSAIEVVLRRRDGPVFFKVALSLTKRAPKPGLEWKIDQERRVVLNNDKPFFPFGVVMSSVKPDDVQAYRELVDNNFNTFMVWHRAGAEGLVEYQRNAAAQGLFVVSRPDDCVQNIEWECYSRYTGKLLEQVKRATRRQNLISLKGVMTLPIPVSERNAIYGEFYDKNIDRCLHGVELVKGFENLTSYFILDEPMSAKYFDQYKFGQDYYARIHRTDGYHPVIVNYSSHIPEGDQYVNWCDILMTDPYWSPPAAENTRSTPNHVSKISWMTNRRALPHRQAVWEILVGPLWSGCRKRPLNHRELRCQTYLALIHRVTGIFYFAYSWVRPSNWATYKELGTEVKVLTPFILGPEIETQITYRKAIVDDPGGEVDFKPDPFDPLKEKYPCVQAAILADGGGNYVLLAANGRHYPVACRFEIPRLSASSPAFGGAKPLMGAAGFDDTLEPYGTRAYRLKLTRPSSRLSLTISQTVSKRDLPNPEQTLPFSCRPDHKNLLPNPSLEEEHTETWPDYCLVSPGVATQKGDALFGEKCLRFDNTGKRRYEVMHMHCAPQSDRPLTHTFSLYMKGDRAGLKAWVRGTQLNPEKTYGEHKTVQLTTSWARHFITGVIPAKVEDGSSLLEVRLMAPGTMWIDGLQLERGGKPTEYEE